MECGQEFDNAVQLQTHQRNAHAQPSASSKRKRTVHTRATATEGGAASIQNKRMRGEHQQVDPLQPQPDMLPSGEDDLSADLREIYQDHWASIRTHHRTSQRIQDVYNYRLPDVNITLLAEQLQHLFQSQRRRFKVNVSFGFVLRNIETGELRYYHSSHNQGRLFDAPHMINNQDDFDAFLEDLLKEDILEWARQQRDNTKWIVICVSNMTVYVNKLPDHPIGCTDVHLPDYIRWNKAIIGMEQNMHGNVVYKDNLCFFRALAVHKGAPQLPSGHFEEIVRSLFSELVGGDPLQFEGVDLLDLPLYEKKLELNINVFKLEKNEKGDIMAEVVQRTHRQYTDTMNLNLFNDHFSLIVNLDQYCKSFSCQHCGKLWKQWYHLKRHMRTCTNITKKIYVGGSYHPEPTVFEVLEDEGIIVSEEERYYPYRITYDYECYFDKNELPAPSDKLEWKAKHVPLSVSVCSNVPGFMEPNCFITQGNPEQLVRDMLEYMYCIQEAAETHVREKHLSYYEDLLEVIHSKEQLETLEENAMEVEDTGGEEETDKKPHPLARVKVMYEKWMKEIPVIGFNSGKYDINVTKPFLIQVLKEKDELEFVVKKSNSFMCVQTTRLKFLDIRNYLAPGFNYATYLKAYKCSVEKGFFPYEWMDNLDKLNCQVLPDHKDFYSTLKGENISKEDYQYCQEVWKEEGMETMREYLIWYNNQDVVPFMEALEKQFNFYKNLQLDMFKDGISVPGLTLRYLFNNDEANFTLVNQKNADLHDLIKINNVGGPSIIFHRYHEANKTKIRENIYQEDARPCETVVGYDANALYLWCIMQDMPTGTYVRRKAEDAFKPYQPDSWGQTASQWLDWEAHTQGMRIQHKYNSKEKQIGRRRLPVDGWCAQTNTVYQFHGCYWHGHQCQEAQGIMKNEKNGKTMEQLRIETEKNSKYIQQCGYNLVELWECQWKKKKAQQNELRQFLQKYRRSLDYKAQMTETDIIAAVKAETLFGMVECDISVPDHLKEYFSEMTPIFKNIHVSLDDIGEPMKQYANTNGLMKQPRRTLVGSYQGNKILLATPLLRWYLNHGLTITKIYQVIQYWPNDCFKQFGEEVSQARRNGDAHPDQAIIADTMKLLGNSAYGKTITNKDKHQDMYFCDDEDAPKKINEPQFRQLNMIHEDLYEIEMAKKKIKYNLPLHIGFFVYQYAKLRMLEFYYDFIDVYLNREDFQYIEMDTDSAYIALAGPSLEELVKPHLKAQFYKEWDRWFPAEACIAHQKEFVNTKLAGQKWQPKECCEMKKKYDRRTPGLFKIEWEGRGMVALCSKTYFGWGEKNKCSTKGISKTQNTIDKEHFLQVLKTKQSSGGVNVGFQVKNNTVYTYQQQRNALSYLYPKRKVMEDGITTVPLMI